VTILSLCLAFWASHYALQVYNVGHQQVSGCTVMSSNYSVA